MLVYPNEIPMEFGVTRMAIDGAKHPESNTAAASKLIKPTLFISLLPPNFAVRRGSSLSKKYPAN